MRKLVFFLVLWLGASSPLQARQVHSYESSLSAVSMNPAAGLVIGAATLGVGLFILKVVRDRRWIGRVMDVLKQLDDRIDSCDASELFYFCKWRSVPAVTGGYWESAYDLCRAGWKNVLPVLFRDLDGAGAQAFIIQSRWPANQSIFKPKYEQVSANGRLICAGYVPTVDTLKKLEQALLNELNELRQLLAYKSRLKRNLIKEMRKIDPSICKIASLASVKPEELDQKINWQMFYLKGSYNSVVNLYEGLRGRLGVSVIYFHLAQAYARTSVLLDFVRDEISHRQAAPGEHLPRVASHVHVSTNIIII